MAHIGLVTLVVPDYDEGIDYFVGVLGFRLVEDSPLDGGKRWVVVAPDGGRGTALLLAQAATDEQRARIGDQTGGRVAFFLSSDDFASDHGRLRDAGVKFVEEPREEAYGTVAVFEDRYGNRWDLVQTRASTPANDRPFQVSDEQIAALTPDAREVLIERLAQPVAELVAPARARKFRRRRLLLMIGSAVFLIPWTIYLGLTLPQKYVAGNWTLTWVGFDVLLIVMFGLTAYLGLRRRQLLVLASFVTGVLLVCDAWFDITTANAHGIWLSVADAVFVELPIAAVLMGGALRLLHLVLARLYLLEHGRHMWSVELLLASPRAPTDAP